MNTLLKKEQPGHSPEEFQRAIKESIDYEQVTRFWSFIIHTVYHNVHILAKYTRVERFLNTSPEGNVALNTIFN